MIASGTSCFWHFQTCEFSLRPLVLALDSSLNDPKSLMPHAASTASMEHLKIHVQLKLDFKTRLVKIMILNNNQNHPRVMKLEIKVQLNGNAWGNRHPWLVGWLASKSKQHFS